MSYIFYMSRAIPPADSKNIMYFKKNGQHFESGRHQENKSWKGDMFRHSSCGCANMFYQIFYGDVRCHCSYN